MNRACACLLSVLLVLGTVPLHGQEIGTKPFVLDQDTQKTIWDAEHVTFKIETYFGKSFMAAMLQGEAEAVRGYFLENARGEVFSSDQAPTRGLDNLTEVRKLAGREPRTETDAAGVARYLIETARRFKKVDRSRLRVLAIEQVDPEAGLWRTTLLLSVAGTDAAGVGTALDIEATVDFSFRKVHDLTADGTYLLSFDLESENRRSSRGPMMQEVTRDTGLADLPLLDNWSLAPKDRSEYRHQIAVEDFDRDGFPDIAVASIDGVFLLLHSQKGRSFVDVRSKMGIKPAYTLRSQHTNKALAAWIDIDNDGYPELLLGKRLYRNVEGKRFEDVTVKSGLWFDLVPLGASVVDYDVDGDLDLYISYQKTTRGRKPGARPWVGDDTSGGENALWRNEGGGKFKNVTDAAGVGGGMRQTFAAAFFFFDSDHYPDLYLANDFGKNLLLRNAGDGTFQDITDSMGVGDYSTSMGVTTGDLNNDGHPEIYVGNMYSKMGRRIIRQVEPSDYPEGVYDQVLGSCLGNALYRSTGDAQGLTEIGHDFGVSAVGWAYAPSMVDLNGNGWLDLYATTGFMSFERGEPDG